MNVSGHADPALRQRLVTVAVALLLLWPMLVYSEFKPWILFDARSLAATGRFLADFLTPAHDTEFLAMVLQQTWVTVAIATCGLTLALVGAIPLTLLATERLSISMLGTGRMRPGAKVVRQAVRLVLILLRSVPELVWALLFVRIVGLGPTAGVIAIALTYCGMLGKVYAEILESSDAHASAPQGGDGGFIETSAHHVAIGAAQVSTAAPRMRRQSRQTRAISPAIAKVVNARWATAS